MRIRRRPPPPPPLTPDPPPNLQALPPNGSSRDDQQEERSHTADHHHHQQRSSSTHPPPIPHPNLKASSPSHPNGCNPTPPQGSQEEKLELDAIANKMMMGTTKVNACDKRTSADPLKKRIVAFDDGDEGEGMDKGPAEANAGGGKKSEDVAVRRRRRPAVLMEGSRCSRVNGRGWRCGQQTLVGYSLCEHHLGKGKKLRSVSGVRGRRLGTSEPIGVEKARSMNSLLHEAADELAPMIPPPVPLPAATAAQQAPEAAAQ